MVYQPLYGWQKLVRRVYGGLVRLLQASGWLAD